MYDFIDKKNMIESQLRPEGISCQNTIDCISRVNREDFVPAEFKNLSYAEYDICLLYTSPSPRD